MKNLSLKAKLFILAGTILIFSICGGVLGIYTSSKIASSYQKINTEILPELSYVLELNDNLYSARLKMLRLSHEKELSAAKMDASVLKITNSIKSTKIIIQKLNANQSEEAKKAISAVEVCVNKLEKYYLDAIDLVKKAQGKDGPDMVALRKIIDEDVVANNAQLDNTITDLTLYFDSEAVRIKDVAENAKVSGLKIVGITNIAAIIIGILLALYITRDLLNTFRHIGNELNLSSQHVGNAAGSVASTAVQLSQATTEQASAIGETAASIEEMSAMVNKNAESSQQSVTLSKQSEKNALHGQAVVKEMITAIEQINISNNNIMTQVNYSNKRFQEIVHVIQEIGNKTKVINDIVFQTKLLSFNASVEAARAGEHGKGFAVVAEEIGNLAQMSGTASRDISSMLEDSIKNVEMIVLETKNSVETLIAEGKNKVALGTKVANECGVVLNDIVTNISQVAVMSDEISFASKEQARGVSEVGKAMRQLDEMTQQNSATTNQTAQAAEQLSKQSEMLKSLIKNLLASIEGNNSTIPLTTKKLDSVLKPKKETTKAKEVVTKKENKKEAKALKETNKSVADNISTPAPLPTAKTAVNKPIIDFNLDLGLKTNSNSSPSNTPSHDDSRFTDV